MTVTTRGVGHLPRRVGIFGSAGLVLVSSVVWGCAGQAAAIGFAASQATRAAGSPDAAQEAAAAVDAFGFDLYRATASSGGNMVMSPASVALALSMARAGANGDTAAQMDKVLHSATASGGGNGLNSLDKALAGISGTFKDALGREQQLTLSIANAPFVQKDLQLQTPYLDTLASQFGAGLRLVDFKTDSTGACRLINSWVSDQTAGRIPTLLDQLDPATRLVLVNAIYLKAPWLTKFDTGETTTESFTRPDNSQVSVPTMRVWLPDTLYASGSGWQAVELPYLNPSLAMTIVVPNDLATFEASLDAAYFGQITAALQKATVDLSLPRFKVETKSDLASVLGGMGMPLALDPVSADFSGITTQEQLYIARVVHQANIEVDENGTVASAAAAVEMLAGATMAPQQTVTLRVDRPFIFAVRDTTTGAILFLGRVVDPSA
jgi:serpin B